MIQEPQSSALRTLLHILNATLRLEYGPTLFKHAKVTMILKPGKPPTKVACYRPISLLPIPSKILEKLLLTRMAKDPHFCSVVGRLGFLAISPGLGMGQNVTLCSCVSTQKSIFKVVYCSSEDSDRSYTDR